MLLDAANSSSISSLDAISNMTSSFTEIDETVNINEIGLTRVNSSLSVLRSRINEAIDAAAMVCVESIHSFSENMTHRTHNVILMC